MWSECRRSNAANAPKLTKFAQRLPLFALRDTLAVGLWVGQRTFNRFLLFDPLLDDVLLGAVLAGPGARASDLLALGGPQRRAPTFLPVCHADTLDCAVGIVKRHPAAGI